MTMATIIEIAEQMHRLRSALPAPRGVNADQAYQSYEDALAAFPADAIAEAITRYLSGGFAKVSLNFYPRAPQLAVMVRTVIAERGAAALDAARKAEMAAEQRAIDEAAAKRRMRSPDEIERVQKTYRAFLEGQANARKAAAIEARERHRAEIRAQYGLTDEVVAALPDRPLPKGMKQAGAAAPGIPEPKTQAEQDAEDLLR
jgi:hypothetical protein